ncbi:MAG: DUF3429 domain-containing protein [Rhodobacter sp.]|nr:DUF3429 domain-containing protein [Rhodobacter sp.]
MTPIPRAALLLGLAGLIPFLWGAASQIFPGLADFGTRTAGPRFAGPYVSLAYGTVILSFMSGVLWGFATRATGSAAATGYALSVLPALWAFFMVGGGPAAAALGLMAGFAGLLVLDGLFWRWDLAPPWWMRLRGMLTAVVLACLAVPALL